MSSSTRLTIAAISSTSNPASVPSGSGAESRRSSSSRVGMPRRAISTARRPSFAESRGKATRATSGIAAIAPPTAAKRLPRMSVRLPFVMPPASRPTPRRSRRHDSSLPAASSTGDSTTVCCGRMTIGQSGCVCQSSTPR